MQYLVIWCAIEKKTASFVHILYWNLEERGAKLLVNTIYANEADFH